MYNKPSKKETNSQAAQRLLLSRGLQGVSGLIFELSNGLKVRVDFEDDSFLSEPYQTGTKIIILTSAEAWGGNKDNGNCWLLHQTDPDTWPSDFHAHDYERRKFWIVTQEISMTHQLGNG